jgi:hypothetical protein
VRDAGSSQGLDQQPATHFPLPSNSIVLPERGTCTGIFAALANAAVLLFGVSLPPIVAGSFACCHLSAYRSHWVSGIKEPGDFRHIGASRFSAYRSQLKGRTGISV